MTTTKKIQPYTDILESTARAIAKEQDRQTAATARDAALLQIAARIQETFGKLLGLEHVGDTCTSMIEGQRKDFKAYELEDARIHVAVTTEEDGPVKKVTIELYGIGDPMIRTIDDPGQDIEDYVIAHIQEVVAVIARTYPEELQAAVKKAAQQRAASAKRNKAKKPTTKAKAAADAKRKPRKPSKYADNSHIVKELLAADAKRKPRTTTKKKA